MALGLSVALLSGCDEPPQRHEVDFSPDGTSVVSISNDHALKVGEVYVRSVSKNDQESRLVYRAPEGLKIFDVFWKNKSIVVFESGEVWKCHTFNESTADVPIDYGLMYDIRIVAIDMKTQYQKRGLRERVLFKDAYPCWTARMESDQRDASEKKQDIEYHRNEVLTWTNVSNARDADSIVFETISMSEGKRNKGFSIIDVASGKINEIFERRSVSNPSISRDGRMIAFTEKVARNGVKTYGSDSKQEYSEEMKIVDLGSGVESDVIMLAEKSSRRPMWSKDGRFLFIPSVSAVAFTFHCDRNYVFYEKNKNGSENGTDEEDAIDLSAMDEADIEGHCETVHGTVPEERRDVSKRIYFDYVLEQNSLHKLYVDMGIAVKILENVSYFSVNPETERILAMMEDSSSDSESSLWLLDYSGMKIKKIDAEYVEKFEAVNHYGIAVGVIGDDRGSVPVTIDIETNEETVLISSGKDILVQAVHHFDHGRLNKAKELFDAYIAKYGLPDDNGYKLIMIATYRASGDYKRMMDITRKVPVEELQKYFAKSGNF